MGEIMNLIEELNRKIDALVKQNEELKRKNAELEEEKIKMMCCENCANYSCLIPEVDRFIAGKNPEKCDDCKFDVLNDGKGKNNWELG